MTVEAPEVDYLTCARPDCATCELTQRPGESDADWKARIRQIIRDAEVCLNGHPREGNMVYTPSGSNYCRPCKRIFRSQRRGRVA